MACYDSAMDGSHGNLGILGYHCMEDMAFLGFHFNEDMGILDFACRWRTSGCRDIISIVTMLIGPYALASIFARY